MLAAAAVVLVPTLIGAAVSGWGRAAHVNGLRYAPVSYLLRHANSADPGDRVPALVELLARLKDGRLVGPDVDRVSDAALAAQADLARPWDLRWGDLLDRAHAAGQLSDAQWRRYVSQSWAGAFQLRLRPEVRRGDRVPFGVVMPRARAGDRSGLYVEVSALRLAWVDLPSVVPPARGSMLTNLGGGGMFTSVLGVDDVPRHLIPDGPQRVHLTATVRVGPVDARGLIQPVSTGTFALLPTTRRTVRVVHDPSLPAAVRASLAVTPPVRFPSGVAPGSVRVDRPPVGLALDVLVHGPDGREERLMTLTCAAGGYTELNLMWPDEWIGKPVDVVFRTHPSLAVDTIDLSQAWDGDVVLHDVH